MSGDDTVREAAGAARSAAGDAQQAGREVAGSKPFRALVSVGLVTYGIVHILIGWLALQIALAGFGAGGGDEEASQQARSPRSRSSRSALSFSGQPRSGCSP